MQFAVDLAALTSLRARDDFVLKMLLREVLGNEPEQIQCRRSKFAGIGLLFQCDEGRASAIVHIIREKYCAYELPIYCRGTRGGWRIWRAKKEAA